LDYQTVNGSVTNVTFQGDTTYYISGELNLYQTNTFEGGAVLKYTNNNNASIYFESGSVLNWKAAAYHPVVFTAKDDNSVGDNISGSSGNPSGYYANPALNLGYGSFSISYFRIAWASQAINSEYVTENLTNGQVVNCLNGITSTYSPYNLRNLLFANVQTNFNIVYNSGLNAQNTTFSGSACLVESGNDYTAPDVTNLTIGTVPALSGAYNGFYNSTEFGTSPVTNNFYPFQSVLGGNYYLTNGCAFVNAGTTNIDPIFFASLAQKTTYPPIVYSNPFNETTTNVTFSPQAQRDTDVPDLGYHYDPLDYALGIVEMGSDAIMTVTNGAAITFFLGGWGIYLDGGTQFISQGTATSPNQLVEYNTVQESYGGNRPTVFLETETGGSVNCQFTDFSIMADDTCAASVEEESPSFNFQDCQFQGGQVAELNIGISFFNCLFNRVGVQMYDGGSLSLAQSLFWGGSVTFTGSYSVYNTAFDGTALTNLASSSAINHNAYINTTYSDTNNGDLKLTNFVFTSGPLGNFYQVSTNLIHMGSTNASALGLYHYTVTTNLVNGQEVPEGTNIVSIAYHYVATDTNGIPISTPGDGIPDYLADANGNGLVDAGEINWTNYNSANGLGSANKMTVFTPLK
jgi:hypothetical protein